MTGCSGRKKEGDEADGDGRGAVSALAVCGGDGHGGFFWGARMGGWLVFPSFSAGGEGRVVFFWPRLDFRMVRIFSVFGVLCV